MSEDARNADVARALAILTEAGFPIDRIRILPAAASTARSSDNEGEPETAVDRSALLAACLALLDDGEPRAGKELARLLRDQFPGLSRKTVNSVLATDGKEVVVYDRETYTYRKYVVPGFGGR